jgi:hypothetical protein
MTLQQRAEQIVAETKDYSPRLSTDEQARILHNETGMLYRLCRRAIVAAQLHPREGHADV